MNEEMRNSIMHAIGAHIDIIITVTKRKLRWCGHITRSTGLAKMTVRPQYKEGEGKA